MSQPTSKYKYRRTEHMFYADIVMDNVAVDLFCLLAENIKMANKGYLYDFLLEYNCVW
jgi:hypothetical protein